MQNTQIASIETVIGSTIDLMSELQELLEKETVALRAANFKEADTFQRRKKELSKGYQRSIQQLINRKADVASMPSQVKETIIQARLQFSKVLSENMRVIDGVRQSSQRLVNKIIESARDAVTEDAGYNARGRVYTTSTATSSPVSISLNEVF